ncbi:hypothetical protein CPLU01_02399 [Colletotrichum plurivorum]|uniref:Uncharacterized protein n=1 Tax=Colletotrichum plurivorum TaxID=2175906 RepID=A0A8H6KWS4_9PEZI|nr:hypothetical protein CPLU01_02399 [Colletotrichum plurivorum]
MRVSSINAPEAIKTAHRYRMLDYLPYDTLLKMARLGYQIQYDLNVAEESGFFTSGPASFQVYQAHLVTEAIVMVAATSFLGLLILLASVFLGASTLPAILWYAFGEFALIFLAVFHVFDSKKLVGDYLSFEKDHSEKIHLETSYHSVKNHFDNDHAEKSDPETGYHFVETPSGKDHLA